MSIPSSRPTSDAAIDVGAEYRARRAELRARLAAERAELLCSLLGVEKEELEDRPLLGDASAATLLDVLATQEASFTEQLERALGRTTSVETEAYSAKLTLDHALTRCVAARSRLLDAFARFSDHSVFALEAAAVDTTTPLTLVTQCYWNDSSLSLRAGAWSVQHGLGEGIGPASLLLAAVRAARKELLTTVALVPMLARDTPTFEGGRSLAEIFRMVTGLEHMFISALSQMGYESIPDHATNSGLETDAWHGAWNSLHATHTSLLSMLTHVGSQNFERHIIDGGGNAESIYMWVRGCLLHDRLHAAHIRADLELDWPERLLR